MRGEWRLCYIRIQGHTLKYITKPTESELVEKTLALIINQKQGYPLATFAPLQRRLRPSSLLEEMFTFLTSSSLNLHKKVNFSIHLIF